MTDDPTNHTERVATDGGTTEIPIESDIIESTAKDEDVPREDLTDALVIFDASLTGMHSTYEERYDYVTVEGVRGYVVDTEAWERLCDEHDIDSRLTRAAQRAHTDQTQQMLTINDDRTTERTTEDIDTGIVIGIDTAEVMN